jgi:2-furoate---CoA ligase
MHLATMLDLAVERYPEAEALVEGPARYTYAQWHDRVERVAGALADLGVGPGDFFGMVLRNSEPLVTTYCALHRLGAAAVPLNYRWSAAEIAYALADAEAVGVLYDEGTSERVAEALADLPRCRIRVAAAGGAGPGLVYGELAASTARAVSGPRRVDDVNIMLYTSGTTGRPKGVPRTHLNDYAATVAMIIEHGLSRFERTLGVMPLYHTMGLHSLLSMVFLNGTFVIQPQFDPDESLELIARERIGSLYLVPTIFHELVRRARERADVDLSCVRKLAFAGAPMTSTLVRALLDLVHPEVFVNHYGSTEVYIHTTNARLDVAPTSAGRGAFHTRVRVVRADPERRAGPDEVLPPGEVGEIIVDARSPEAFRGYHKRPEATARALRDGWYFTGDTGYLDERGEVHLTGRVDDMIITGGENVHPVEVEDVLAAHPGVLDVAVVGLPDEKWGQVVAAFVVPASPDVTAEELDRFCLESKRLAPFKRPRRYVFVRAIPKTASGKVLRRLLRDGQYEEAAPAGSGAD